METPQTKQESRPEKIRKLFQSKQQEIFSADPKKSNDGDYGSAAVVVLTVRTFMSKSAMLETLLADARESLGEKYSDEAIEDVADRIVTTIENLLKSKVFVEKNGTLELNLE